MSEATIIDLFGNYNPNIETAYGVLCRGMSDGKSTNNAKAQMRIDSPGTAVIVRSENRIGKIIWETTSNHLVVFYFFYGDSGVALTEIEIGDEESKSFYPEIKKIADENKITVNVIKNHQEIVY